LIFDNLKKSIAYTLEHLGPEVVPFLVFFICQIPQPLTTVLILCIDLGTDLFPAISCAYEEAESDIMDRKPRNAKTDRLVGWRLFVFSYLQIGLMQVAGVFAAYFSALAACGFSAHDVGYTAQIFTLYYPPENHGWQAYPADYRHDCLRETQTAVFLAIVIVQWGGLLVCKTRKLSLFEQGMRNSAINVSLLVETALACFLLYTPGVQTVFGTYPLRASLWLPSMPFAVLIVAYDELRKWWIRKYPNGKIANYTYY